MDAFVFAAVLFAAACHAGWNAAIKRGLDPLATTVLISLGAGVVALALAPFSGLPAAPAWPWVMASVVIHLVYFAALIESYRAGDMGQVYPLARGSAPLGHRSCRPRGTGRLLWPRDLGDDGGADRDRRGVTRNQRAVRRGDRRGLP